MIKTTARLVQIPGETKSPAGLVHLGRIDHECFPNDEAVSDRRIKQGWWWVLYGVGDVPVAYCGLHTAAHGRGHLTRAGVSEEARGHRLQRKMIILRMQKAKRLKLQRVITYTDAGNVASSNNLAACGFRLWVAADGVELEYIRWFKDV